MAHSWSCRAVPFLFFTFAGQPPGRGAATAAGLQASFEDQEARKVQRFCLISCNVKTSVGS
eukprot:788034-Pelagomonas_calceolata.AAC.1